MAHLMTLVDSCSLLGPDGLVVMKDFVATRKEGF